MLNNYFKSIIDQDDAPVVVCDPDSTIIYMNPASIARYHGDLTGKSLMLCHNADSNAKIHRVLDWFREDTSHNTVFTSRIERENTDIYMVALRDSAGTLIGYYEKHICRNRDTGVFYDF